MSAQLPQNLVHGHGRSLKSQLEGLRELGLELTIGWVRAGGQCAYKQPKTRNKHHCRTRCDCRMTAAWQVLMRLLLRIVFVSAVMTLQRACNVLHCWH